MIKKNIAFLNLKGHYRGLIILQALIESNFLPILVIEEDSKLSAKNSSSILKELEIEKNIIIEYKKLGINHLITPNHNTEEVRIALEEYQIDLIILGDCRILKPYIFKIPKYGAINIHPGYLPYVRGNTPYIWALIKNLPQGCTAHFVDDNIDTGDIILRRKINIENIHSYKELLTTINTLCAEIIIEILLNFEKSGIISSIPQNHLLSKKETTYYFTLAPFELKEKAKKKIIANSI